MNAICNDIVVIGEGPAGLTTAIIAAQQGLNITLLKKRNCYSRNQIIFLSESSLKLLGRIDVLKELNIKPFDLGGQPRGLIKIKKLEKALMKKLETLPVKILTGEFKGINEKNILVKNEDKETAIPYELLVGADGSRSAVRKTLNIKCNKIGGKTLVGSSFLPTDKAEIADLQEKETADFFIRNVATPVGRFVLLHNKISGSAKKADKQSILEATKSFGWNLGDLITSDQATNIENVTVALKEAKRFVDEKHQAILVGDAASTGSFYLGRGANLALKNAEIAAEFLVKKKHTDPEAFTWYNTEVQKLSNELLQSNKHLFQKDLESCS